MNHVTPILGQPLCFLVRSRTHPEIQYTVNWIEHYCTCPQFHKQAKIYLEKHNRPLICWHMEQAMLCGWDNYVSTARELQLAQ